MLRLTSTTGRDIFVAAEDISALVERTGSSRVVTDVYLKNGEKLTVSEAAAEIEAQRSRAHEG